MAAAAAMPSPMNEDQVQSFHSGRVSGCVTLQAPKPASSTCSRKRPARMARTTSPICTIRVFVIVSLQLRAGWQARRDSNPQHAVLETAALPLELLAFVCCALRAPPGRRRSRRPPSLALLVVRVLAAPRAELRLDQLVGHGPLVLGGGVVPLLAHVALERDDRAVHRIALLETRLEPTTRIELVTSSLPRTCSAN